MMSLAVGPSTYFTISNATQSSAGSFFAPLVMK